MAKNKEEKKKKTKCTCTCEEECTCGNECNCGENCNCTEECNCNHEETNDLNKELEDKYLRLQAEFVNFRNRQMNEISNLLKYENEDVIKKLLPTIDNFERAIKMDNNDLSDEVSKFLEGFKMIYTSLINVLDELEVKEIEVLGKEFDPVYAEAVLVEHDENKPENVVLEVLTKGYMYKDKVIRPAMVKVNK